VKSLLKDYNTDWEETVRYLQLEMIMLGFIGKEGHFKKDTFDYKLVADGVRSEDLDRFKAVIIGVLFND